MRGNVERRASYSGGARPKFDLFLSVPLKTEYEARRPANHVVVAENVSTLRTEDYFRTRGASGSQSSSRALARAGDGIHRCPGTFDVLQEQNQWDMIAQRRQGRKRKPGNV